MNFVDAAHDLVKVALNTASSDMELQQACQQLFSVFSKSSDTEENEGMSLLANELDCGRGSYLALICGALIEHGAKAQPLSEPLLKRITPLIESSACVAQICNEGEDFSQAFERNTSAEQKEAWELLGKFKGPVAALLSADPQARQKAKALQNSVDQLAPHHIVGHWMSLLLKVLDREPLLVLEPASSFGLVGTMSGIVDNHQLHVLLMDVFPGSDNTRVSEQAAATARGHGPQETGELITGHWNMYSWQAWSGTLSDNNEHWIWGEGNPCDIPLFENHRVVLLGPPSYKRTWNSARTFKLLRADLTIEKELSNDEVHFWLTKISNS